jgi:hypothetical protein
MVFAASPVFASHASPLSFIPPVPLRQTGSVTLPIAEYNYNSDWTPPVGGTLTRWNGS